MDVRGPADKSGVGNDLIRVNGERVRFEPAEQLPNSKGQANSFHSSEGKLAELVRQLKELPEVREDLVKETIVKLRDGQYATRESAEQTAERVMQLMSEE